MKWCCVLLTGILLLPNSGAWGQDDDPTSSADAVATPPAPAVEAAPDGRDQVAAAGPSEKEHYIRIHRTGGVSPFLRIEWEVIVRGGTPVAKHAKIMVGYDEPLQKVALLTTEEFEELWRVVERNDGFILYDLTEQHSPHGAPVYEVEIKNGDMRNTFRVADLSGQTDLRYREILQRTLELVTARTGIIPFRNVFYDVGSMGWVDIDARPRALVYIDDRSTNEHTPLFTYELSAGKHAVRLVSEEKGIDRMYEFTVQPGTTTILNVDLR